MTLASCDTMVATPGASADGQTVFAKNSDRPQEEAQPLVLRARESHPQGAMQQLQFVSVPRPGVSFRHVGSRPCWCLGYEHGFNEHQVVIGNESLPSKLPESPAPKLIGMELLRLGLERSSSAAQAVDVMTGLIERHGQGRFANAEGVRTYDNIFLIADPREAFVLEAVGHEWAVREISGADSVSNVGMIGRDARAVSESSQAAAVEHGLFDPHAGQSFSFAGAFADASLSASGIARQRRSSTLLRDASGRVDVRTMVSVLRDHSDGEVPDEPHVATPHDGVSICVHRTSGDHPGASAASLIAHLCNDGSRLPVYWCGMYSPCMNLFFPVFIEGELPTALSIGGAEPSDDSPWWLFYRLTHDGLRGGEGRISEIRAGWRSLQDELFETAYGAAAQGRRLLDSGRGEQASAMLTEFMAAAVDRMLATARGMLAERVAEGAPGR